MSLLARYADCTFWLARYIERAENLARILEIQETFARDSRGSHDWRIILRINVDTERFLENHAEPTGAAVLHFYGLDRENPNSIISNIHFARENARALRPLISTEMWTQLNVFYNRLMAMRSPEVSEERVARFSAMIKEGCDTQVGVTAGTFYRDEAYSFYELGAAIECADQTTRLLDAKFLAMEGRSDIEPGSAADVSYWTAVLRSVAGYQAFRRQNPLDTTSDRVATFLLCDPSFPRSVACNIGRIDEHLERLRRHYRLKGAGPALERLDEVRDLLELRKVEVILRQGRIHEFNDRIQLAMMELTSLLAKAFFGREPVTVQSQSQTTSGQTQSQSS